MKEKDDGVRVRTQAKTNQFSLALRVGLDVMRVYIRENAAF